MNNFNVYRQCEDELISSQSSDEKMDTGSESLNCHTSNSNRLRDFDNQDVLRLQNPEQRLQQIKDPESIVFKMSHLHVTSPDCRPKDFRFQTQNCSTLMSTTNHPLMNCDSPDEMPDLILKKVNKNDDEKECSFSSIEDERLNQSNGYEIYTPQSNTSKNNLYYSDNFVTPDSLNTPPDFARVPKERRNIVLKFLDNVNKASMPQSDSSCEQNSAICIEPSHSTPKSVPISIPELNRKPLRPAEWSGPSQLRKILNFELPIEMKTSVAVQHDLDSPEALSSSREDKSAYQALLDPYTGSVALRPTVQKKTTTTRRKIQIPTDDDDSSSLDSISGFSMNTEDIPLGLLETEEPPIECEDVIRSKSTATVSESSDQIPEYSLMDELREERSWIRVEHAAGKGTCDMKVIEPFKRVLSHGGYSSDGAAIIVFSACYLPDNRRADYRYVMDNFFLYVIWTLQRLVTEEYILVYLHGSGGRRRMPSVAWLHECYKLIDRRIRKSLKHLYLVHPTFWLKSFVVITKPFISSKFHHKLSYMKSLRELGEKIPVEPNAIPDIVKFYDAQKR